ncbi:MAG: serine hydrolase [Chloroflexaceae bacterium]
MPEEEPMPTDRQTDLPAFPYLPGLDGLRALAVIAVLLYHADLPVRGGFLGVEIFFVLSGFLITALLITEWLQHDRVNLTAFWLRRARRLLPALFVLLAGTLVIATFLPDAETVGLGSETLAALGYVMNWHLILGEQSYFTVGVRPSLLQHLWSLAVEEQFYLLWPLIFIAGVRFMRLRGLLVVTVALVIASTILTVVIFEPGADPSRIYYGTDTRAGGVLIGAILAMVWAPWRQPVGTRRRVGQALDIVGVFGLIGLALATVHLFDSHPLLYRGGLTLVALGTVLVIMATSHPHARLLPTIISWGPIRWIGTRSYGIYLWHWPIFQVTRPVLDVPFDGSGLLAARIGAAMLLAELSYRCVELPVRRGAIGKLTRILRPRNATGSVHIPPRLYHLPGIAPAPGYSHCHCTTYPTVLCITDRDNQRSKMYHRNESGHRAASDSGTFVSGHSSIVSGRRFFQIIGVIIVLFIGSCSSPTAPSGVSPVAELTPTPAPAAMATVTGTPEPTDTPIAATSATPTVTGTPTSSPVPTATATPSVTTTPVSPIDATATVEAGLPPIDPELAVALQAVLDATVADGYIPGAVVAVNIPGQQTWVGASGVTDRAGQMPITPDTRMRIASISKVFTAVVVMQLVEEGRLNLDDPLSVWLPNLVPNANSITVRTLLQQTTGLYDYLEDSSYANQAYLQPDRIFTPEELVQYAAQFPLAFPPGSAGNWDYSSTNYVILGMVVEAVTGNSLAAEMRQRIFEPLGLESTFFVPDEAIEGPFATGYIQSTSQRDVAMSFAFGTANLVSTVDDIQTFARALFAGDLVSDESRAQMLTFVSGHGQYSMPDLAYGLGVMRNMLPVARAPERSTVYGHIGGFGGFRSAVWYAPESGITLALGVNQGSTNPNILAQNVFATVLDGLGL